MTDVIQRLRREVEAAEANAREMRDPRLQQAWRMRAEAARLQIAAVVEEARREGRT